MKERKDLSKENKELKVRLAEAEELLAAIKSGAVDALITDDQKVFTLKGADYAYRVLVETMNEGAATLALNGAVLYCNNRLAEMLELPLDQIIGNSIFDFVIPEDVSEFRSILKRSSTNSRGRVSLKRSDGTSLPILVSCNLIQLDVTGVCIVCSDLSQLVETQTELEKAKRLSDIGVLATTVAHELRNPLAAIGVAAYNIRKRAIHSDIDKPLVHIDQMLVESDQIINNLLSYSRRRPPYYERVNIADILEESIKTIEDKRIKDISIVKNIGSLKRITIEADPVQMKEVFNNILNNAYDAAPFKKGKIKVIGEYEDEFIKVAIEDNGAGIDKDVLKKAFDPFFSTKAKGTGLGLSVCRQIVDFHNGSICIENKVGQGASVIVCLPKERKATKQLKKKIIRVR